MIEPTEDEKKNGWTAESLNAYRRERARASFLKVYEKPEFKPAVQNHTYNPLKWRRR